jgi:hypothetical protein
MNRPSGVAAYCCHCAWQAAYADGYAPPPYPDCHPIAPAGVDWAWAVPETTVPITTNRKSTCRTAVKARRTKFPQRATVSSTATPFVLFHIQAQAPASFPDKTSKRTRAPRSTGCADRCHCLRQPVTIGVIRQHNASTGRAEQNQHGRKTLVSRQLTPAFRYRPSGDGERRTSLITNLRLPQIFGLRRRGKSRQ